METPSVHDPKFSSRMQRLVRSKYGLWILGLISFLESSLVIPIIIDPFMIVYILADRSRALAGVVVTITMSVAGGVAAYLAAFFFQSLMLFIIGPDAASDLDAIMEQFRGQILALTLIGAITPVPYTLVAMAVGFMKGNILIFILGSIVGRSIRYGIVGYLVYKFGPQAVYHIRRNLLAVSLITIVAIAIYLLWL